ncbi:hypothetical protein [Occultella kanbiaonis]|uniref:hypothetical protein n=1 Tax=Occultella kanbiaonis TaxID=2675754 RepID=UPI0012B89869|nr:hypothetical protein [Occultella kanbiaonis]
MPDDRRSVPLDLVSGSEGAIIGTVVCAAVIAYGVGHADSTAQLSLMIIVTVGVYWIAHLHAATISSALTQGHHPATALRHALTEAAPVAAASILPLAVLLLTRLAGASLDASAWTALLATIALLAFYSYRAGARGGLDAKGRIASAAAGAGIGVLVALLKVALH